MSSRSSENDLNTKLNAEQWNGKEWSFTARRQLRSVRAGQSVMILNYKKLAVQRLYK